MRDAILIVLLTAAMLIGGGFLFSEVAFRIEKALTAHRARKAAARERMKAYWDAAEEAARPKPRYYAHAGDGSVLLVTEDVALALKAIIGKQGASITKDGVKVAQNRTLVQGGGKK